MGIKKDLNLVGNDFSNTATWFFIAYLIAEVPNGKKHCPYPLPSKHPILFEIQSSYNPLQKKSTACKKSPPQNG
jgi:hypothetical protein